MFVQTLVSSSQLGNPSTDLTSGIAPSQLTLNMGNVAPQARVNRDYTITAPSSLTARATASDPDGDSLRYSWDINGDGVFDGAGGVNPTLTWTQLRALGIRRGQSYDVRVMVSDGHDHTVTSEAVTLTVN